MPAGIFINAFLYRRALNKDTFPLAIAFIASQYNLASFVILFSHNVELSDECHYKMTTSLQTDLHSSKQCYLKKRPVALVHSNDLLVFIWKHLQSCAICILHKS